MSVPLRWWFGATMQLPLPTPSWSANASPQKRVPARLAPFVAEALRDPRFAALWMSGGEGRAYAAACLAMSKLARPSEFDRRRRYDAIVTRRRHELLSELAGAPVPDSVLRLMRKCAWNELGARSWRRLLRMVAGRAVLAVPAGEASLRVVVDDLRQALRSAPIIGPRLLRQIPLVPPALRLPAVLGLANRHLLSRAQWEQLSDDLARSPPNRVTSLVRRAAAIRSYARLRDLMEDAREAVRDATPFPPAPDLGSRFLHLRDGSAMRREGLGMRNCLYRLVPHAASGARVYYRWQTGDGERATVSLWRTSDGYALEHWAGKENAELPPGLVRSIRDDLVAALGPGVLDPPRRPASAIPPARAGFHRLACIGARTFPREKRERIAAALRAIRCPVDATARRRFLIVDAHPLYVQALALDDPPGLVVEVASHHWIPEAEDHLNTGTARLLESAGFAWPRLGHNFATRVPVMDEKDCERVADALLGILHAVFDVPADARRPLTLKV